jgi:VacB/RNase II family 3'-5' exoribonuclease
MFRVGAIDPGYHATMNSRSPEGMNELTRVARQAMQDYGFLPDFSSDELAQLATLSLGVRECAPDIRDLRQLLWASIDNDDSRDLDQLSAAEPLSNGAIKTFVAIADVDCLVKAGTPIDVHAAANTTSVYTAVQIFPMLPEKLSTDLTSLAENQDRLSVIIEMTFDAEGAQVESDIYRAMVRNRAKLAYDDVAAWLNGTKPKPPALASVNGMEEQIRLQDHVAQSLKRRRTERGALTLDTVGSQAVLSDGVLADLRPDEKNRAKELIQHLMIAANKAVAEYLESRGLPSLRRVLRKPERWNRIVALAAETGTTLPAEPDSVALNAFLVARRDADPARFADLSLSVVKLLGAGVYALKRPGENIEGHFGLALSDYTHATAPNRRFPDLITQRLLKAAFVGNSSPYSDTQLGSIAEHCTTQERNEAKVERRVAKSAAAALLSSKVGQSFDAIVTGASDKGTWVRIKGPVAEGKVVRGAAGLDVGARVRVQLVHVDIVRGFIDFEHLPP